MIRKIILLYLIILQCDHRHVCTNALSSIPPLSANVDIDNKARLQKALTGKMILAPLTKGGNLPFRRLCADFGAKVSMSEMIYARSLLKGDPVEKARLRRCPNEETYGVQIATNQIDEGVAAMKMAHRNGADFVDLNCGCPIYEATRRGLGSSLLRSPDKLQKLVAGLVKGSEGNIPVTVKIRLGCELDTVNCLEHVTKLREAGAAAVTIHGRTAQQGYSRNADWTLIDKAVQENNSMPIIGNGDILTHYEARRRMMETGVDSVMVGRGALEKPWIFQEFNDGATWTPDIQTRVEVYRTLAVYMKEHFGDDDMGRKKSWTFLPWHFDFLSRYVPYPESEYGARSIERPLLQSRFGESTDGMTPLEILMANRCSDAHDIVASILWESDSNMDAVHKLTAFAESHDFNEIVNNGSAGSSDEDEELTNLKAKGVPGIRGKRRGRKPGPKRSDEEIAQIRAQRAAKKAGILADGGIWPP